MPLPDIYPDYTGDEETAGERWMQTIAQALKEHLGIDLGDISDISDPDQFADLVETATKNAAKKRREKKNRKTKVKMSHQSRPWRDGPMTEDEIVRHFLRHTGGGGAAGGDDDVAAAFLKHVYGDK